MEAISITMTMENQWPAPSMGAQPNHFNTFKNNVKKTKPNNLGKFLKTLEFLDSFLLYKYACIILNTSNLKELLETSKNGVSLNSPFSLCFLVSCKPMEPNRNTLISVGLVSLADFGDFTPFYGSQSS